MDALHLLRVQWTIERLSQELSVALVGYKFLWTPPKISFHMRKKSVINTKNLRSVNLTLELSEARVVALFPQASQSRPCVCACQTNQPKLCWSTAPRAWPLILQSNPSTVFSNSLLEWLPDETTSTGLQGLKLELCAPDQWFVEVLSAQNLSQKPQNKVQ